MEKIDELVKLLQQNRHGIKIKDAAGKLGVDRATVYKYLHTLDYQGKAYYEKGTAYPSKPSKAPIEQPSSEEYEKYLAELKEIGDIGLLSPDLALGKFTNWYALLPLPLKKLVQKKAVPIWENSQLTDSLCLKAVLNEVGLILYGYYEYLKVQPNRMERTGISTLV